MEWAILFPATTYFYFVISTSWQPSRWPTFLCLIVLAEPEQYRGCISSVTSQRAAMRAQVSYVISDLPLQPKPKSNVNINSNRMDFGFMRNLKFRKYFFLFFFINFKTICHMCVPYKKSWNQNVLQQFLNSISLYLSLCLKFLFHVNNVITNELIPLLLCLNINICLWFSLSLYTSMLKAHTNTHTHTHKLAHIAHSTNTCITHNHSYMDIHEDT